MELFLPGIYPFLCFCLEQISNLIVGYIYIYCYAYIYIYNPNPVLDFYYKDTLAYFAFYVMGARIRPANSMKKGLFILAILLLAGEIYLNYYFKYYPNINFSLFVITYLILKDSANVDIMNRDRYLVFAYIYPYKIIYILLKSLIKASPIVITLLTVLSVFLLGELLYKLRVKFLDYILVGIH